MYYYYYYLSIAWNNVVKEPIIQEPSLNPPNEGFITDLAVEGVWQRQCSAMFDVCIVDSYSPSYSDKSLQCVLAIAEREKKRKYIATCILHTVSCHFALK